MRSLPRSLAAAAAVAATVVSTAVAAPVWGTSAPAAGAPASTAVRQDGPHSPTTRRRAATTVTRHGGVVVRDADLGDVELGRRPGDFRAPVRGLLITPDRPRAGAPLVVISHLRFPACDGGVSAYPCPGGHERRFDRGMSYLGESLARQGYSVVIPDLAPLYIAPTISGGYDQRAGWSAITHRLVDAAVAGSTGRPSAWGAGLTGVVDARRVSLVAHSRSGQMAGDLVREWSRSSTPITSVLAYGPSYAVADVSGTTAMVPDVPYLAVVGDRDEDVHLSAVQWLTEHSGTTRRSPAMAAVVPGLGHTYVNRALWADRTDDRIACDDGGCADARTHERVLTDVTSQWLAATVRHRPTTLPMTATSPLPATLAGLPARWLAVTQAPRQVLYQGGVHGSLRLIGTGATLGWCRYVHPMDPDKGAGTCPDASRGTSVSLSRVAQVRLTPGGGVVAPARTTGAHELVLQVSPTGDRSDRLPGSPLRARVRTSAGRTLTLDVPATTPALRTHATAATAGTYGIGTVRLALPAWVTASTVTAVELTGGSAVSRLDIREVDLVTR